MQPLRNTTDDEETIEMFICKLLLQCDTYYTIYHILTDSWMCEKICKEEKEVNVQKIFSWFL